MENWVILREEGALFGLDFVYRDLSRLPFGTCPSGTTNYSDLGRLGSVVFLD